MKEKVYIDGYYKQLLDDFQNAVNKHKTSIVIIFDGKSGKGKTTLSNQTGNYLDPNFNLINIYYEPDRFLKGLANAKPGSYHSFDEAMIISSRSAMSSVNKMIIQAMSMIRSKRIYVSFCVNSIFDLDRNLVLSRADALMHVYGEGLVDRGRFATFFKAKGDNFDRVKLLYLYGKKFYDYSKPRANFIGRFTKEFIVDETKYEAEKQIAIDRFLIQEPITKKQQRFDTLVLFCIEEGGLNIKDISKEIKIPLQTLYDAKKRAKILQKAQELTKNENENIV